jgi:hypothetical protein
LSITERSSESITKRSSDKGGGGGFGVAISKRKRNKYESKD